MSVSYLTISEILLVTALPPHLKFTVRVAVACPRRRHKSERPAETRGRLHRSIITSLVIRCSRQLICTAPTVAPTRDFNRRLSLIQRVRQSPLRHGRVRKHLKCPNATLGHHAGLPRRNPDCAQISETSVLRGLSPSTNGPAVVVSSFWPTKGASQWDWLPSFIRLAMKTMTSWFITIKANVIMR